MVEVELIVTPEEVCDALVLALVDDSIDVDKVDEEGTDLVGRELEGRGMEDRTLLRLDGPGTLGIETLRLGRTGKDDWVRPRDKVNKGAWRKRMRASAGKDLIVERCTMYKAREKKWSIFFDALSICYA